MQCPCRFLGVALRRPASVPSLGGLPVALRGNPHENDPLVAQECYIPSASRQKPARKRNS
jgi:hypothetical protein